ncbi:hypothetical protein ABZT08_23355 [Streptomyces sp. NPDC005526]|uniref:hypothetical protein n=1 Tax=Streptomyces sp. NPDC005526 TaxID=3156885 RepID=UPI0033BF0941
MRDGSFSPVLLRGVREVADVLPDADRRMRALAEAADGYRLTDAAVAALLHELASAAGEAGWPGT